MKLTYKTIKQKEVEPRFESSSFIGAYGFGESSSVFHSGYYVYTLQNIITKQTREVRSDKNLPRNTYVHVMKDSYTGKTILKEINKRDIEDKIVKIEIFDKEEDK